MEAETEWHRLLVAIADFRRDSQRPALDRMMQFWSDVANLDASRPEVFEGLNQTAKKLFAADPKNSAAEVAITWRA